VHFHEPLKRITAISGVEQTMLERGSDEAECRPIIVLPREDQGSGEVQSERSCAFSEIGVDGMVSIPMHQSFRQPLKVIEHMGSGVDECRMLNIAWPLHSSILRDDF
jgi:hypothetical protein